jgi:hypothetical protein
MNKIFHCIFLLINNTYLIFIMYNMNIKTKKDNTRLFRYNFRNDDLLLALNPFLNKNN